MHTVVICSSTLLCCVHCLPCRANSLHHDPVYDECMNAGTGTGDENMPKNLVCKTLLGEAVTSFSSVPLTERSKDAEGYSYVVLSCEAKQEVQRDTTHIEQGTAGDDDVDDLYI